MKRLNEDKGWKHLLVNGHAACTPNGDVREWNPEAILTEDPAEVTCQRCVMHDPRAVPVEPKS